MVAKSTSPERSLTDERLRLLEGLSYRAAMALQKARLGRHREQSLHVADALLEYARALARDGGNDLEERIVRLAAEMLGAREVSLWLQAEPGVELAAVAIWDEDESQRARVLETSFPAAAARTLSERSEPFVLGPDQYAELVRTAEPGTGGDVAVAPLTLDQSRMGFLVAGAPEGETFGELQLKMLAGLADQATLALS
jgi:GAF domain-containing protein